MTNLRPEAHAHAPGRHPPRYAGDVTLEGTMALPRERAGIMLFAHGSGSSRHSPRNRLVAGMNQRAAASLGAEHRLEIVPGATHLFEEPGKLEQVAGLARDWFQRHLGVAARHRRDAAGSSVPVRPGTSQ